MGRSTGAPLQPKLAELFVQCSQTSAGHLRAIGCAVVTGLGGPLAVFCVDYAKLSGMPAALTEEEELRLTDVGAEVAAAPFASAFRRTAFQKSLLDIQAAGHQPAALRHEVSAFLTQLCEAFIREKQQPPEIAYLQLVDRRRDVVRTIHGFGLPLSFQVSLSHPLDGSDIQAEVVRDGRPRLVAGKDPTFDPGVFRTYHHEGLVRLWLPLFPFPISCLCARANQSVEAAVRAMLAWGDEEGNGEYVRRVASWSAVVKPPPLFVWGTLELGYKRPDPSTLSLSPFTPDLAFLAAGQAYALIERVFRATLAGAIDAWVKQSPDSGHSRRVSPSPCRTGYTLSNASILARGFWSAAVPTACAPVTSAPSSPVRIELDGRVLPTIEQPPGAMTEEEGLVARTTEVSVRSALRLDDYLADQYVLLDRNGRNDFVVEAIPTPSCPASSAKSAVSQVPRPASDVPFDVFRPICAPRRRQCAGRALTAAATRTTRF